MSARAAAPTALDYLAAGLKLIPIPYGSKAPRDNGWQLEENCIGTIEQAGRLDGKNIGIAHLWSGTCAVDADDYLAATTWLAKRGIALDDHLAANDAVQISSGRPNRCKLWYRLPDGVPWLPTLNLRESYGVGLELRCAAKDGSATVVDLLPPSTHPDTHRPYVWKGAGDWRDPRSCRRSYWFFGESWPKTAPSRLGTPKTGQYWRAAAITSCPPWPALCAAGA